MPGTVVSSKFGVNFITITNVILLVDLIYIIVAAFLDLTSQELYRTTISDSNHGYYMYVNSVVTGTTKVMHAPAFGSMLWITS